MTNGRTWSAAAYRAQLRLPPLGLGHLSLGISFSPGSRFDLDPDRHRFLVAVEIHFQFVTGFRLGDELLQSRVIDHGAAIDFSNHVTDPQPGAIGRPSFFHGDQLATIGFAIDTADAKPRARCWPIVAPAFTLHQSLPRQPKGADWNMKIIGRG